MQHRFKHRFFVLLSPRSDGQVRDFDGCLIQFRTNTVDDASCPIVVEQFDVTGEILVPRNQFLQCQSIRVHRGFTGRIDELPLPFSCLPNEVSHIGT